MLGLVTSNKLKIKAESFSNKKCNSINEELTFNDFFTKNLGYDINRNNRFKSLKNTSTIAATGSIDNPSKNVIRKRSLSPIPISKSKYISFNKSTQTNANNHKTSAKINKAFSASLSSSSASSSQSASASSSSSSSPLSKIIKNSDEINENQVNLPNKLIINNDNYIGNINNQNKNLSNCLQKHAVTHNKSNSVKNSIKSKPPINNDINKQDMINNTLEDKSFSCNKIKNSNYTCLIKKNQEPNKKDKLEQLSRDLLNSNKAKKINQSKHFNSFRIINNQKSIKETENLNSKKYFRNNYAIYHIGISSFYSTFILLKLYLFFSNNL